MSRPSHPANWALRGVGYNPSILPLPRRLARTCNATYVATSRFERNNINSCWNRRVVKAYSHPYSSTLVSLLDERFRVLTEAYMWGGDGDGCERGRWRGCDARLFARGATVGVTFVNFWGTPACRGHGYAHLHLSRTGDDGALSAVARKQRRLVAPRNSGLLSTPAGLVELDINGSRVAIHAPRGGVSERTLQLPEPSSPSALHTSGHPIVLNATHFALLAHYHAFEGGAYRYGHGYRHRVLVFETHTYRLARVSAPFCVFRPCKDIEFVMNTFWDGEDRGSLRVVLGVDDCYGAVRTFALDSVL